MLGGLVTGGARGGDAGSESRSAEGTSDRSFSTQNTEQNTCLLAGGGRRGPSTSKTSPSGAPTPIRVGGSSSSPGGASCCSSPLSFRSPVSSSSSASCFCKAWGLRGPGRASPAGCPGARLLLQLGDPRLPAGSGAPASAQPESLPQPPPLGSAEAARGPGAPGLCPGGLGVSGGPAAPPAGVRASRGPPAPLTVLCSSPIAARGPSRRCPSSRRDPHPAPAGSGGSGSARLGAPLLLPGPSSEAGTPRAPSREPALPGGGARGARPGLLLLLLPVRPRGRAPPRGHRGPLAPAAGARAPHADRGAAAAPGSPRAGQKGPEGGDRQSRAIAGPRCGPGGRRAVVTGSRGLWRRSGAHREGQPEREPAAAAPGGEAGARDLPLPRLVLHLEPYSPPLTPPLWRTPPHTYTRARPPRAHSRTPGVGVISDRDALPRPEFTLGLHQTPSGARRLPLRLRSEENFLQNSLLKAGARKILAA